MLTLVVGFVYVPVLIGVPVVLKLPPVLGVPSLELDPVDAAGVAGDEIRPNIELCMAFAGILYP